MKSGVGVGMHITKTKKRQRDIKGNKKPYTLEGLCMVCSTGKTTYECSECRDNNVANPWICNTNKGAKCFETHLALCHNSRVMIGFGFGFMAIIFVICNSSILG